MIDDIVILGGGSAGFLAALTLKRRLPQLSVRVIRSPDIGVIGVGEGTTQFLPRVLFKDLGLKIGQFYAEAQPTWKLGIRFLWGPRDHFHYTFSRTIDDRFPELPKNHGYYADEDFDNLDLWSALMSHDKALPSSSDGRPNFCQHDSIAFHVENEKLVTYLEARCRGFGVEIIDATVAEVEVEGENVAALRLADGRRITAGLFVDASGFRAELLGRALGTDFRSYSDALFCDRAVIGGWPRTTEPIKPYTVAETMDAGWCWQIEHEHWINRGYVYSSSFISDEAALEEFLRKNPQAAAAAAQRGVAPRVVKFRSGRYEQMWRGNVVAVGNASGFVEPLEASALQVILIQSTTLADFLIDSDRTPTATGIALYNRFIGKAWDSVRDFLAVHYRFNTRLDTPFWKACRDGVALGGAAGLVDFYLENGPSSIGRTLLLDPNDPYGIDGYFVLLVGQKVPHRRPHCPTEAERRAWLKRRQEFLLAARRAFDVKQALAAIRQPSWKWN